MSELRTDFKDEILQEGETHRVYDIKRKGTDEIVESDIYLEKAYTPLQEGNEFGAKEVNEIHGRLNGLAPQNLLINGDFQINQRGQTNYSSNSSTRSYGLDYWCSQIENGQTLTVYPAGENGVRLVGSSVSGQYFQEIEHIENGKNHIVSTVIDIRSGTGKINLVVFDGVSFKTKELVNGYNEFDLDNSNIQRVGLIFSGTFDIFCNFIRLDEGDIAYPHVVEDDAIALMRCRKFYQKIKTAFTGYAPNNTFSIIFHCNSEPMYSTPTEKHIAGLRENVKSFTVTPQKEGGFFVTLVATGTGAIRCYDEIIELSCEPL